MKQLISLKNICRSYRNGDQELQVLKNINLEVNEGEFVAIMGPSGSGKSTLMNTIGMLDTPTSGEYYLEGQEVAGREGNLLHPPGHQDGEPHPGGAADLVAGERPAPETVLQHLRTALQGHGPKEQAARHERGRNRPDPHFL